MPVPAQVRGMFRDDHEMVGAGLNGTVAPGAHIPLPGCVRLNRGNGQVELNAHATTAAVAIMVSTTITTSVIVLRVCRNGLNPTGSWYWLWTPTTSFLPCAVRRLSPAS